MSQDVNRRILEWVSDSLHDLLGFSDEATAEYVLSLARSSTNATALSKRLMQDADFPIDKMPETERFSNQLIGMLSARGVQDPEKIVPRLKNTERIALAAEKEKKLSDERINERHSLLLKKIHNVRKQAHYELVDSDDEPSNGAGNPATHISNSDSVQESGHRRREEEKQIGKIDTAETRKRKLRDSRNAAKGSRNGNESGSDSDQLAKDIKERDEFAERIRKRDKDGKGSRSLKKRMRNSSKDHDENTPKEHSRKQLSEEITTDRLREISRRAYLKKREEKQLERLREELEDEKYLFAGENLTRKEEEELRFKERIFKLASERVHELRNAEGQGEGVSGTGRYRIPDAYVDEQKMTGDSSKKLALLNARYQDSGLHKSDTAFSKTGTDQTRWEEDQIRKGQRKNRDNSLNQGKSAKRYELVIDPVEFDAAALLPSLPFEDDQRKEEAIDPKASKRENIRKQRESLPIAKHRNALVEAVKKYQVLIVQSETGSGKTTQIPQYLIEEGFGRICCTQPRRVAAMSVAARVAEEMDVKLGGEVGYSIRFEDCTSDKTAIKYMTDGMLLREFLSEPDLASYDVIIIDEAHERSMSTDIVMGLVKDIARFRGDEVRVIISSATLNTKKFSEYFDNAPIYEVPGRRFEVEIMYTKAPEADYLDACCVTTLQIHASQPKGDILMFLSGQDEIEAAEEILRQRTRGLGSKLGEIIIAPIYSTLPSEMQAKIFEPTPEGARKVVLATNIAETSVTIPGIVYVIDPGFCKQKSYSSKSAMESLLVVPISRAGAKQRAGRAGRMQPGKCFRLYTKWSYLNEMDEDTIPEILRTNLSQVVLVLLSLGIDNLMDFDFLDAPPQEALMKSLEQLYALGALNSRGQLTKLGRRMAEMPLDPMMSKALLAGEKYKCTDEVATICAMLSVNNSIFYRPKEKKVIADAAKAKFARGGGGDHIALLNCFNQWRDSGYSTQWCFENFVQSRTIRRARDVREQLDVIMERVELECTSAGSGNVEPVLKAFAAGFFYNACKLQKNGTYRTIKNPHTVQIHPSSSLARKEEPPDWVVYHELVLTSKEFMRQVFPIEGIWLFEVAPHVYQEKDVKEAKKRKMPKTIV